MYVVAIDIGGTKTLAAIVRPTDGLIVSRKYGSTDTTSHHGFVNSIKSVVGPLIAEYDGLKLSAVGIGTAGHVNPVTATISSRNLGLKELPLQRILSNALNLPVFIDNDANAGAIGELIYGQARGREHFAFLSVGTGIGVGLVLNGRIYRGKRNYVGEIGHATVAMDGEQCACGGRGCLENIAAGPGIVRTFKQALEQGEHSLLDYEQVSSPAIFRAAMEHKDPLAEKIITEAGEALGVGIRNLNRTLDLEMVVLGGGIALAAPQSFLDQVDNSANAGPGGKKRTDCLIVLSELYPDSIILGAANLPGLTEDLRILKEEKV